MPRSGLFSLLCQGCRQRFDGDAGELQRVDEPPQVAPTPVAPEPPPESKAKPAAAPRPAPPTTAPRDARFIFAARLWWAQVALCGLAVVFAGWAAAHGRSGMGITGVVVGATWTLASALGTWAFWRGQTWARGFGVILARIQLLFGVLGLLACGWAVWALLDGERVPWRLRGVFGARRVGAVLLSGLMAIALLSLSDRFKKAVRALPKIDASPPRGRLGWAAVGLLGLCGVLIMAAGYGADFRGWPRIWGLRGLGWVPGIFGLVILLRALLTAAGEGRRGLKLASSLALVALIGGSWAWAHTTRAEQIEVAMAGLADMRTACRAAWHRPHRKHRHRRRWRSGHGATLADVREKRRPAVTQASAIGAALYASNPPFRLLVDSFWRHRIRSPMPPADEINFCYWRLRKTVRNRLSHY